LYSKFLSLLFIFFCSNYLYPLDMDNYVEGQEMISIPNGNVEINTLRKKPVKSESRSASKKSMRMENLRSHATESLVSSITLSWMYQVESSKTQTIDQCRVFGEVLQIVDQSNLTKEEIELIKEYNDKQIRKSNNKFRNMVKKYHPDLVDESADDLNIYSQEFLQLSEGNAIYALRTSDLGKITYKDKEKNVKKTSRVVSMQWFLPLPKSQQLCDQRDLVDKTILLPEGVEPKMLYMGLNTGLYRLENSSDDKKNCMEERDKKVFKDNPVLYLALLKVRKAALNVYVAKKGKDDEDLKLTMDKNIKIIDQAIKQIIAQTPKDKQGLCWDSLVNQF
jgi:hypothetical protein